MQVHVEDDNCECPAKSVALLVITDIKSKFQIDVDHMNFHWWLACLLP